jgi:hypothetical protein
MRSRLLLLVSGPVKCMGLEPLGAKSLLLNWLLGDCALGSNHWCLASGLAVRGYSRQIGKVLRFHSLRVSLLTFLVVIVLAIRILQLSSQHLSQDELPMTTICLCRGTGWDAWHPSHYLIDPMSGFLIQRSLGRPSKLKGHPNLFDGISKRFWGVSSTL